MCSLSVFYVFVESFETFVAIRVRAGVLEKWCAVVIVFALIDNNSCFVSDKGLDVAIFFVLLICDFHAMCLHVFSEFLNAVEMTIAFRTLAVKNLHFFEFTREAAANY